MKISMGEKNAQTQVENELKKGKRQLESDGRAFRKEKLVFALFKTHSHRMVFREPRGEGSGPNSPEDQQH